jgi:hypothetical protein
MGAVTGTAAINLFSSDITAFIFVIFDGTE